MDAVKAREDGLSKKKTVKRIFFLETGLHGEWFSCATSERECWRGLLELEKSVASNFCLSLLSFVSFVFTLDDVVVWLTGKEKKK